MKRLHMKGLFVIASFLLSTTLFSQEMHGNKGGFSIGGEYAIPVITENDDYASAIGGSIQGECRVGKKAGITLNVGYRNFPGNYHLDIEHQLWAMAGGRYYYYNKAYLSFEAGIGASVSSDFAFAHLNLGPGAGIKFNSFDATLKYISIGSGTYQLSTLGLRLAYVF